MSFEIKSVERDLRLSEFVRKKVLLGQTFCLDPMQPFLHFAPSGAFSNAVATSGENSSLPSCRSKTAGNSERRRLYLHADVESLLHEAEAVKNALKGLCECFVLRGVTLSVDCSRMQPSNTEPVDVLRSLLSWETTRFMWITNASEELFRSLMESHSKTIKRRAKFAFKLCLKKNALRDGTFGHQIEVLKTVAGQGYVPLVIVELASDLTDVEKVQSAIISIMKAGRYPRIRILAEPAERSNRLATGLDIASVKPTMCLALAMTKWILEENFVEYEAVFPSNSVFQAIFRGKRFMRETPFLSDLYLHGKSLNGHGEKISLTVDSEKIRDEIQRMQGNLTLSEKCCRCAYFYFCPKISFSGAALGSYTEAERRTLEEYLCDSKEYAFDSVLSLFSTALEKSLKPKERFEDFEALSLETGT